MIPHNLRFGFPSQTSLYFLPLLIQPLFHLPLLLLLLLVRPPPLASGQQRPVVAFDAASTRMRVAEDADGTFNLVVRRFGATSKDISVAAFLPNPGFINGGNDFVSPSGLCIIAAAEDKCR